MRTLKILPVTRIFNIRDILNNKHISLRLVHMLLPGQIFSHNKVEFASSLFLSIHKHLLLTEFRYLTFCSLEISFLDKQGFQMAIVLGHNANTTSSPGFSQAPKHGPFNLQALHYHSVESHSTSKCTSAEG